MSSIGRIRALFTRGDINGLIRGFERPATIAPLRCPRCSYVVDRASQASGDGDAPTVGCLMICIRCASVSRITDGGGLEAVDVVALDEKTRADVRRVQILIAEARGGLA